MELRDTYRFLVGLLLALLIVTAGLDAFALWTNADAEALNSLPFLPSFIILTFIIFAVVVHRSWDKLLKDERKRILREFAKDSYLHPSHRPDPNKWNGLG